MEMVGAAVRAQAQEGRRGDMTATGTMPMLSARDVVVAAASRAKADTHCLLPKGTGAAAAVTAATMMIMTMTAAIGRAGRRGRPGRRAPAPAPPPPAAPPRARGRNEEAGFGAGDTQEARRQNEQRDYGVRALPLRGL